MRDGMLALIGSRICNDRGRVMRANGFVQREAAVNGDVAGRVRNVIAEQLGIDPERVTDDARLLDDLGADWLDRLELMIVIEDQLGCSEIGDDIADQIVAVGDLVRFVEAHPLR